MREKAQQHDETYYLWATAFFMAFNRRRGFRPELVSETVGVRAFHFIEQNLTTYYEMLLMDKKEAATWARRWVLGTPPGCLGPPPGTGPCPDAARPQDAPGSEGVPGAAADGAGDGPVPRAGSAGQQPGHQE